MTYFNAKESITKDLNKTQKDRKKQVLLNFKVE